MSTLRDQFNKYASQTNSQGASFVLPSGEHPDVTADTSAILRWASELNNGVVISGSSDYARISGLRNAILELRSSYFSSNSGLSVRGEGHDELDRRFLLIEHELDGLLRRSLTFSTVDSEGKARSINYTALLNEKETQIVELEQRVANLQDRLKQSEAARIELESKITALKAENFTLRDPSYKGEKLEDALRRDAKYEQALKDLEAYRNNFSAAASLWLQQLTVLSAKYPNERFQLSPELNNLLLSNKVRTYNTNGLTTIEVSHDKTIEVPVQDARTQQLVQLLAVNLKKLYEKYPKLSGELSLELTEFLNQEVIDAIAIGDLHRIVEIVRFVPQTVRVENVYAYSSSKSRRVEFHLRVLIKALLEELLKLKDRTGAVLDIDEGVIGMINQEIMGVVSVDDILKVFRAAPRIVEVERIVEKVVERVVEVPQVIPVEKYVEKIIEVPKFVEVEKVIHVPVEVVKVVDNIVEKLVEVPTISEKVVEVPTLKEKIVQTKI